jgi:hypothetical protein
MAPMVMVAMAHGVMARFGLCRNRFRAIRCRFRIRSRLLDLTCRSLRRRGSLLRVICCGLCTLRRGIGLLRRVLGPLSRIRLLRATRHQRKG